MGGECVIGENGVDEEEEVDAPIDGAGFAFVYDALPELGVHEGGMLDDEREGFLDRREGSVEVLKGCYEAEAELEGVHRWTEAIDNLLEWLGDAIRDPRGETSRAEDARVGD